MTSDPPETKRATPRTSLRERAQVAVPGTPVQAGTTIDISASGVSIMLPESVASGTACHVRFEIPAGRKKEVVQASAKAVYCVCVGQTGFRIGFQFNEADAARKALINAL